MVEKNIILNHINHTISQDFNILRQSIMLLLNDTTSDKSHVHLLEKYKKNIKKNINPMGWDTPFNATT